MHSELIPVMEKDYGSWSLAELKTELQKRKAKVTGKKAVLVQRLTDYDKLFGGLINDPEATYRMTLPNAQQFLDINANTIMPELNEGDIQNYSVVAERENLERSKNMYDESFLLTARMANSGEMCFVTCLCLSEMRRNVSYNVTVQFQENLIIEAQCECAAGMGPHAQCKHVLVLIYAIIDFSKNKKIKTKTSTTSTLQVFHRPAKEYTGTPIKAEDLKLKLKNSQYLKKFDPRPDGSIMNKEKYEEHFKNMVVNFCGLEKCMMPIVQLVEPANKKAAYVDHDYLKENEEERYIKNLILDDNQLKELEYKTKNDKNIWKQERVKRLQSSDFGKICKVPDTNKKNLTKSLSIMKNIKSPAISHGRKYEPKAIKKFSDITGMTVTTCGIIVNKKAQFLGCTPDGLVGDNGVLEIKCPYSARNQVISGDTVPYLYLCEESGNFMLDRNHNYFYQVQGQLLCTERTIAYFCVYTIKDYLIIKIQRDENFIEAMFNKLETFYEDHFKDILLNRYFYNIKV